jgi:chromosome segregation ATPase
VRQEEKEKAASLEREVERLSEECSVVKDESTALRYQLSSANMELQQTKELLSEKERSLTALYANSSEKERLLHDSREKLRVAQKEADDLRCELRDMETALGSQEVEMNALSEQLTEKTLSRDKERAELLRVHNSLDSIQAQLETEKQDFAKEVTRLTEENNDIRRAFRRLLQQKVTLWQHADELEEEQQRMGTWVNSKGVTECMECGTAFTLLTRKHHCRSCGRVCCSKCCEKKAQLPFSK